MGNLRVEEIISLPATLLVTAQIFGHVIHLLLIWHGQAFFRQDIARWRSSMQPVSRIPEWDVEVIQMARRNIGQGAFLTVLGYLNTNILSPQAMPNTIIRRFSGRLVSTWRNMPAFLRRKQDNGTELAPEIGA
ncbi:hypothetical protein GTA08_BOTSDO07223 [Botryosphaeria dothidea]|uniref:Uncharacterized protein n=1 Tax=Botryosphaeria dothidea TaxID=55169 RepID=A0A8H4ITE5_9PEZI|nr:hypothetical protein GTA08_BOTSDO11419 [Botryosphaeria dothidea]KAF4306034.1 hypothetical protein GTA08_BOTSDO07223 [Botryosphaeria dothidea]